MCVEKDPLNCHRALLVCRRLSDMGVAIEHIHADGALESQRAMESRLLTLCKLPEGDLFTAREEFLSDAYAIQANRVGYQDAKRRTPLRSCRFMKLFTIGFAKKSAEQFFTRLVQPGLLRLVDVRLNNVSQLAGFTKKNDLEYFLVNLWPRLCACAGIGTNPGHSRRLQERRR